MNRLQKPLLRFTVFQLVFWFAAATVLMFAQSMEMPRRFALPPAVSAAALGLLISFVFPHLFAYATRTKMPAFVVIMGILLTAFIATPLSRFAAFVYLGFDYASFQWVYYFQGTLRLILLLFVWCGLFLYFGRYFGHAYYLSVLQIREPQGGTPQHLKAERRRKLTLVSFEDIIAIQSADDYVAVITSHHEYLRRDTLKSLEQRLDSDNFVRVHKSTIVNLAQVRDIEPMPKGDFTITMRDGKQFKGSRRYKAGFDARLKPKLV